MTVPPPSGEPDTPWHTQPAGPPGYPEPPDPEYPPPPDPVSAAPAPFPPYYPAEPRRRRGLRTISLVLVLLVLIGGGIATIGYFISHGQDGTGPATPQAAVEDFLRAIYVDQNPTRAAALTCQAARDPKRLTAKIDEVRQQNRQYDTPKYSWGAPKSEETGPDRAVLSTTVTLATANAQQAAQKLRFTLIKTKGWFVCDVRSE